MLEPSRGECLAVFHIVVAHSLSPSGGVAQLIDTVRSLPGFTVAAMDHARVLRGLVELGLAQETDKRVDLDACLKRLHVVDQRDALPAIAARIVDARRSSELTPEVPSWARPLDLTHKDIQRAAEWVSTDPLVAQHLGRPALDQRPYAEMLGFVGELMVAHHLRAEGWTVRHLSIVSDHFGFDLVAEKPGTLRRIEVKSSLSHTRHRVFLSRNECDVAERFPNEWELNHIVLHSNAMERQDIDAQSVLGLGWCSARELRSVLPADGSHSRWTVSCEVSTAGLQWHSIEPNLLGVSIPLSGLRQVG